MTTESKKASNPTDKHVGNRVRMRRMLLGMSQEKLGDALRISFQQVQKYEKGSNRISASRLQQIATVLKVSVPFFFQGLPDAGDPNKPNGLPPEIQATLSTAGGISLMTSFSRIRDAKMRLQVVNLVGAIADLGDIATEIRKVA